jgi:peptidoglycan hydrolase CwlO-like protein
MDTPPPVVPPPPSPENTRPVTPRPSLRQQNVSLRQQVALLIQENHHLGAANFSRKQQTRILIEDVGVMQKKITEMKSTIESMDKRMAAVGEKMSKMERELEVTRRKAIDRKVEIGLLRGRIRE